MINESYKTIYIIN